MDVNYVENIRYTGFSPSYEHKMATKKIMYDSVPSNREYYDKISGDKNKNIHYFDKETRWKSTNDISASEFNELKKEKQFHLKKSYDLRKEFL